MMPSAMHHNPTSSFPASQPQILFDSPNHDDADLTGRFKPSSTTSNNKNNLHLLDEIIPDIEAVGKLISYAKALDILIENARAHGDDEDWDDLAKRSKEAWAEIKQRNKEQKERLECIFGVAIGGHGHGGLHHISGDHQEMMHHGGKTDEEEDGRWNGVE